MTNLQSHLSIGIPSVLVIGSWTSNNVRLSALSKRVDSTDKRVDGVDGRIDSMADSHHRDMLQFMQALTGLHGHVAIVESR